jgi:DNA (cytosine-5)-methyltransferase 1
MKKNNKERFKALSLFASAGIADFGFENTDVDVLIASELLQKRMDVHSFWHQDTLTICGDITKTEVKKEIISKSIKHGIDFVFATPPCQGVSLIGKNKSNDEMLADDRNYLIFHAFEIIDAINPKVVLIENVARFFKIKFIIEDQLVSVEEIIRKKYGNEYNMDFKVFNAAEHGVPQHRERAIIRLWKNDYIWGDPAKQPQISMEKAIGDLPSLESGEKSSLKNHYARIHTEAHIKFMKNTPSGKSAFENPVYYPKNEHTGERLKGYAATYKRMTWEKPAPTITMRNDCISSQSNVHPGRKLKDGTYSDARVLTIRELFILSSLNPNLDLPPFASDIQIRHMIGEAVPPKLIYEIVRELKAK